MEDTGDEKDFCIEKAKAGRAACKKCKQKCETGVLRMAKLVPNYFSDGGSKLKQWYHVDCLFEVFKGQKATTKRIESVEDIDGWDSLTESDRDMVLEKFEGSLVGSPQKGKKVACPIKTETTKPTPSTSASPPQGNPDSEDNLFVTFREICDKIAGVSGYIQKSKILQSFLIKGSNGKKFEGDFYLWFKLLLPSAVKRVYNLQSKQLIKVFSRIFRTDHSEMLIDLEQGDVSETVRKYFDLSKSIKPKTDNKLSLYDVDRFLDKLTGVTREDNQIECFQRFSETCNSDDLKTVIRLIKHDLRMNAGSRHILDALSPLAYSTFQSSRDLESVVTRFAPLIAQNRITDGIKLKTNDGSGAAGPSSSGGGGGVQLMSPISPMLAEACKSVEKAIAKNPEGMYSEIKYDGERVQIHKRGSEFKFFSRNLKPVMDHKISRCKEFIPKAFPAGQDLILDSEIVVVNTKTGELLPFGTLGVHKREQFVSSEVCLFVFDCIYYNGEDLTKKPLSERKKILEDNMKPIKNHVQLSEYYLIKTKSELASMTAKVLKVGLEGLVLKSIKSLYQPGKRNWLKVKKDYLFEGQMADTADLVVLGGWFGTGRKGGMLSIFLMGCFDMRRKVWKTVTKVSSGLDDNTMDELQKDLKELIQRANPDNPPHWLVCKKPLIPDYIAIDPSKMPVWEITGAEFTKSEAHTANGISIRFPRITKMRPDKSTTEATNLDELELLFKNSKEHVNVDMLFNDIDKTDTTDEVDIKTKFFDPNKSFENDAEDSDSSTKETSSSRKRRKNEQDIISQCTPLKKLIKFEDDSDEDQKRDEAAAIKYSPPERKTKYKVNQCWDSKSVKSKDEIEKLITNIKKEESLTIFDEIRLYVKSTVARDFENSRAEFLKAGGKIVKNSCEASHVLHSRSKNSDDFMQLRKKYQPLCRHVTYKWIQDCIDGEKLLPIGNYAVCL